MRVALTPPRPRPADAPASEFSAARARAALERLVGDGVAHPVGSEAHDRMRDRVIGELRRLSYAAEVQDTFACDPYGVCATITNIRARLPGRERGPAVLLVAHYDSVPAGPGASDDGSGVATLLEVARALKSEPPRKNEVVFLFDDGEEAGLLGADAFAEVSAAQVGVVINVEARGTEGPSMMFETSRDNRWLVDAFASSVRRPVTGSLFYSVSKRLPNDTDLTVFKEHGMAGLNFAFVGGVMRYHTPLDRVEYASPSSLQHHGDNALALVRFLADADLTARPRGDAVFFDVLSLFTVWWPQFWTLPLAALTAALVVFAVERRRRQGMLAAAAWRWGLAAALAAPLAAGILGFLLLRALRLAGSLSSQWVAHPMPAIAAFWLLGLAVAAAAVALAARRAGPEGAWTGIACVWGALAAIVTAVDSADSYPLLVPALAMGAVGAVYPRLAALVGGLVAAILWFPIAWLLFDGVGVPFLPVVAAAVALATGPLLSEIVRADSGERWAVAGGAASAAVLAAGVALAAPTYSQSSPQRVVILLHQDERQARWLVTPEGDLPDSMRAAATFGDPEPPFPWMPDVRAFAAPAPPIAAGPPDLSVVGSAAEGKGRRLRLHLASRRGAHVAAVFFPPEARVQEVTMGGRPIGPLRERAVRRAGGWKAYWCRTLPAAGIDLEVVLDEMKPIVAYVGDQTSGLPDDRLQQARPKTAVSSGSGDLTVMTRKVAL
ncbi:MAG TPA: M20/M25/M40 family metallo-hydrolase [Vicinamibacteria bacterium]|nr:M20/M25/M40 family metallo-hydrolase [Vicinamibacteria bacterium]